MMAAMPARKCSSSDSFSPPNVQKRLLTMAQDLLAQTVVAIAELTPLPLFPPRWVAEAQRRINILRTTIAAVQAGVASADDLARAVDGIQSVAVHAQRILETFADGVPTADQLAQRATYLLEYAEHLAEQADVLNGDGERAVADCLRRVLPTWHSIFACAEPDTLFEALPLFDAALAPAEHLLKATEEAEGGEGFTIAPGSDRP